MPTRDEEAEQWQLISLNSRKAAQHLLVMECHRSSISRSYYAAYSAVTSTLIRQGITLGHGGSNPGHAGLPALVVNNLTLLPLTARYDLNKALRRLYRARVEADYAAVIVVDNAAAKRSIRDLARVFQILGLDYQDQNKREKLTWQQ